jgi:hypothetical protein
MKFIWAKVTLLYVDKSNILSISLARIDFATYGISRLHIHFHGIKIFFNLKGYIVC